MATPSKMPGNASTMKDVGDMWQFLDTELAAVTTFLMEKKEDRANKELKSARHNLDDRMLKLTAVIADAAEEAADNYKKLPFEKSKICKAQAKVRELEVMLKMLKKNNTFSEQGTDSWMSVFTPETLESTCKQVNTVPFEDIFLTQASGY